LVLPALPFPPADPTDPFGAAAPVPDWKRQSLKLIPLLDRTRIAVELRCVGVPLSPFDARKSRPESVVAAPMLLASAGVFCTFTIE
jgi:hypothetical protein